jgi:hypothetical protein
MLWITGDIRGTTGDNPPGPWGIHLPLWILGMNR